MSQSGVFVTGTDTGVGKTWVGQIIIRQLSRQGVSVVPRKPVESGWQANKSLTDAGLLAAAAGGAELGNVCPNRFQAAISPVRAAALDGVTLSLPTVYNQCIAGVKEEEFLYVEGAGGFFSPLVNDPQTKGLNADLAKRLCLPVLLVAEDRLGCINQVLLSLLAIKSYQLTVVAIVLNEAKTRTGGSESHLGKMDNATDLSALVEFPVFYVRNNQREISDLLISRLLNAV